MKPPKPSSKQTLPDAAPDAGKDAQMWNSVGADWLKSPSDRIWRAYSDRVTSDLILQWIAPDQTRILKTDLFDEAVSVGLYPMLQDLAEQVHATDIASNIVDAVLQKYPRLLSQVADIQSLPFENAVFDTVISTSTLDHFEQASQINASLREIRRVLKTGGHLMITLDNPLNPKLALRALLPEATLIKTGLMRYHCGVTMSHDALGLALKEAGYEVLRTKAFLHCPRVSAVKAAGIINRLSAPRVESAFLNALHRFEKLERWPTRWRSAHFTAVLARAR